MTFKYPHTLPTTSHRLVDADLDWCVVRGADKPVDPVVLIGSDLSPIRPAGSFGQLLNGKRVAT